MASYIPGGGQVPPPIQGGGGGAGQLVQLAMAVKAFKLQEADKKKHDAQETASLLMGNPQLLTMTDPKVIEKALKEGYGLSFDDKQPANPANAAKMPPEQPAAPQAKVDPNNIAAVGNAMQGNKSGAQAGAPASPGAANKAPGGGVEKTGQPDLTEHLAAAANQHLNDKFGAMAPLYGSAMSQMQMEQVKAQSIMDIEHTKQLAASGDFQAMGRLMLMSGKQVTDADMRAMVASSNMHPDVVNQALGFALGNESEADKAKRFDTTLKTVAGNPEIMGFVNPLDVSEYARSIVYGGSLPQGMNLKALSVNELTEEAKYEDYLVKTVGLPGDYSHLVARARSMGLDVNLSMPKGFQTIPQRETGAKEKQASASMLSAHADMIKAQAEWDKVSATIKSKVGDDLNEQLRTMIEADKAKHPYPQPVQDALINKVAEQSGLMPEQVSNWHSWITGKEWQYTPNPDSDLARQAAGSGGKAKPKAKREPTTAESGGLIPNTRFQDEPPMKSGDKTIDKGLDLTINPLYEILFGQKGKGGV